MLPLGERKHECCLRRLRDSNPRYGFPYTHFPGVLLQPLGQVSLLKGGKNNRYLFTENFFCIFGSYCSHLLQWNIFYTGQLFRNNFYITALIALATIRNWC